MSVDELLDRAHSEDAREDFEAARRLLDEALSSAPDPAARGRVHAALAAHCARRLDWRGVHAHERRSVEEHARAPGAGVLSQALALYDRAIDDFGRMNDGAALASLRRARELLVDRLGEEHPMTERATHTLAGRLRSMASAAEERVRLYRGLLASAERRHGADHRVAIDRCCELGFALWVAGQERESRECLERAFYAYVLSPATFANATRMCTTLGALYRALDLADASERMEAALLRWAPDPPLTERTWVRWSRLARSPAVRREFERRCVEHAARQFPALYPLVLAALDGATYRGADLVPRLTGAIAEQEEDSSAREILLATREVLAPHENGTLDRAAAFALSAIDALEHEHDASLDPEALGPLHRAEEEWQDQLFRELWEHPRARRA